MIIFNISYEFNFHFYLFNFTVLDSVQHFLPKLVVKLYEKNDLSIYKNHGKVLPELE